MVARKLTKTEETEEKVKSYDLSNWVRHTQMINNVLNESESKLGWQGKPFKKGILSTEKFIETPIKVCFLDDMPRFARILQAYLLFIPKLKQNQETFLLKFS